MKEIIIYDGLEFSRFPESKHRNQRVYYSKGSNKGERLLHRYIWIKYNGPIEKGYEIHHIDGDQNNNDISNLKCLTKPEHMKEGSNVHRKSEWMKSEDGVKHLENMRLAANEIIGEGKCEGCNNKVEYTKRTPNKKYCSLRCKNRINATNYRKLIKKRNEDTLSHPV